MLRWTGERAVPDQMITDRQKEIMRDHLTRYRFARAYCIGKRVIDAACGEGYGSEMLSEVAKKVIGLDISREAIDHCKENYPRNEFIVCDLEKGCNIKADVIVSFETIEHLEDPSRFLETCAKNCDTFIFSIPVNLPGNFHKVVYSIKEIEDLIKKYFTNITVFGQFEDKIGEIDSNTRYIIGVCKNENPSGDTIS